MFQQDKNKAATDNQPPTTFWKLDKNDYQPYSGSRLPTTFWKKTGIFEL